MNTKKELKTLINKLCQVETHELLAEDVPTADVNKNTTLAEIIGLTAAIDKLNKLYCKMSDDYDYKPDNNTNLTN